MEFTAEELIEIEEMASLLFSPDKISKILGVELHDFTECLMRVHHPATIAFARGSLKTEAELRKSILKLAKQGSSPAQNLSLKMLDELSTRLMNLKLI